MSLISCNEAVSSLDVSMRAQILNRLERLRGEFGLTYLFIAHDLTVVKHVGDWVGVMYLGRLCESGLSQDLNRQPAHPYTAYLLAAVTDRLSGGPAGEMGEIPSSLRPPSGCRHHTRYTHAQRRCTERISRLRDIGASRRVACHFPLAGRAGSGTGPTATDPNTRQEEVREPE